MTRLVWTRPALEDLLEIAAYIRADNPAAARRFAAEVKKRTDRVREFPESGRLVPELPGSGLRGLIFGNYRIIYRVAAMRKRAEILAVRHGARRLGDS